MKKKLTKLQRRGLPHQRPGEEDPDARLKPAPQKTNEQNFADRLDELNELQSNYKRFNYNKYNASNLKALEKLGLITQKKLKTIIQRQFIRNIMSIQFPKLITNSEVCPSPSPEKSGAAQSKQREHALPAQVIKVKNPFIKEKSQLVWRPKQLSTNWVDPDSLNTNFLAHETYSPNSDLHYQLERNSQLSPCTTHINHTQPNISPPSIARTQNALSSRTQNKTDGVVMRWGEVADTLSVPTIHQFTQKHRPGDNSSATSNQLGKLSRTLVEKVQRMRSTQSQYLKQPLKTEYSE